MKQSDVFLIRPAVSSDCRAIAEVHVASWKTTYKGIVPQEYLSLLSVEARADSWSRRLATAAPEFLAFVSCDEVGQVVGFVCGGHERSGQSGFDGELHAIYLRQEVQRKGLGTSLVRRFMFELRSAGFGSMLVWVLAQNPSRKFYEALGGALVAEKRVDLAGTSFVEVGYGWKQI